MNNNVTEIERHLPENKPRDIRKTGIHPDFWYPVAQSKQVKKGKTKGVIYAGEPIVIVRTEKGNLFALENRCAHRQVPLTAGDVKGERIQCGYHCWSYDKTGRCVNIPYLDKDRTLPNGVRSYPCREAYNLIFIYPGDLAKLDAVKFPQITTWSDQNYKTRYLDREIACHYSFMHENLMDMNHQHLHRKLMGGIQTKLLDQRGGDDWIECDYTFTRASGKQHIGEKMILQRSGSNTEDKGVDLMTIKTEYPYQKLTFWTAGSKEPALDLWNVYVPVDQEQRIHHTFGMIMIRKPSFPGLIHLIWPAIVWFTESIFKEDRWIVEREQEAFNEQGEDQNQEIFPIILSLRKILVENGVALASAN